MKEKIFLMSAASFLLAAAGLSWGVPGEALMEYSVVEIFGILIGMTVLFFMAAVGVSFGVRLICSIAEYIADRAETKIMKREERYVSREVVCRAAGKCLWASEIEEFPIAVTKKRFKNDL